MRTALARTHRRLARPRYRVGDRPENGLDDVVDSKARAILVWREDEKQQPAATKRLGIGVVKVDSADAREQPGVMNRVMRLLGLKEPTSA